MRPLKFVTFILFAALVYAWCVFVSMAARAADFVPSDPAPLPPVMIVPPGYVAVPESFVNYALIYLSDRTGPANAIFTDLKAAYDAQTKTPMTCVPAKLRN